MSLTIKLCTTQKHPMQREEDIIRGYGNSFQSTNSRLTRGEGEGQHKPKRIPNVGLCVGLDMDLK